MQRHPAWVPSGNQCCACLSGDLKSFRAKAHDGCAGQEVEVMECRNCGFAWQFPVFRTPDESAVVFSTAYQEAAQASAAYFDPVQRKRVAQVELDYLESLGTGSRRLLDVGGGDGTFACLAAARGWDVTAVDPAIDPTGFSASNLRVLRGTASSLAAHERFDVVTLWDVIEHVPDPSALLAELTPRVREGGWLVLETGNYRCFERVRAGARHWIYQLDHRWYFCPTSLRRLLSSHGWQVRRQAPRVLRPDWKGHEVHAGPTARSLFKACLREPSEISAHWAQHTALRSAALWPQSGLEIFCIAAQHA